MADIACIPFSFNREEMVVEDDLKRISKIYLINKTITNELISDERLVILALPVHF